MAVSQGVLEDAFDLKVALLHYNQYSNQHSNSFFLKARFSQHLALFR